MNFVKLSLATALAAAAFSLPALAQDTEFQLPEQCITSSTMGEMDHSAMDHSAMGHSDGMMAPESADLSNSPEHVQVNMRKMMITMPAMEQGMMNEDPDVAFACGMIAHHQGAIDMAQVLIDHGDDPKMIKLAEEIMEAQVGEIELMKNWLTANVN
ncbi:hypothetical protein C7964_103640 [Loktanella sp. PT4BL]|jgi:uncharacterized protein (DUF305 family)|uniref:DUF305 domain-containing protein n=1 Tax=Loktanella sp. PT4BL TaxID=2135611 RepID=UPI000D7691A2|nr:DUF305 domain-containing protein [Loktanella sp. PT4BL]PXW69126.1 hypothetical protein C7964_103640 [Loktanella sp. PT4BL]